MIIAILMAGGKGTRLKAKVEKPLLKFQNMALIDHVVQTLYSSKYIDEILVAVSPNTSKTKKYLLDGYNTDFNYNFHRHDEANGFDEVEIYDETDHGIGEHDEEIKKPFLHIFNTFGLGYIEDLSYILRTLEKYSNKDVLLFINSDLPLISSNTVDNTIEYYLNSDKEALSLMVPVNIFKRYNIKYSIVINDLVPSGLNILVSKDTVQDEELLVVSKLELAFNINTLDDLNLLNKYFKQ
ncbi:MAG: NTP transferase domain-containing protein [Methanobrevibacter sp.]|jgi:adenosylcobinamide-phosphate guanylyltransferase|nr:NTP transferase domain-containing protein [Candidatus Methanovirga aequatorialis]